ncbi:hypothetical protein LJB87_02995 [Alistipes sp. OttesenSCG-928-L06]|nr:hypothetical protein [Alistipes sp. OttesenSCG-928-L06]
MKKYLLILGMGLLSVLPAAAQQTDTVFQRREIIIIDDEKPIAAVDETRVVVRESRRKRLRFVDNELKFLNSIGLGYNGLVSGLNDLHLPEEADWMELEAKSVNFHLQLVGYQYNFCRHLGIRTGLDLEVCNFRFSQNVLPALSDDRQTVVGVDPGYHLRKSKLVNCYFNVPLLVSVGIGRRNQLELYGGMVGGWRWNSYVKEKSSAHGKDRHRGELNLRNFHYGYTAGITFHDIGIYASYFPHSIFKADKGPDVRQVNIGLTLNY